MIVYLAALVMAGALPASSGSSACAYDRAAMLALTPDTFDQDMNGGWRRLARSPCERIAADLIALYRQSRWSTLKPGEVHVSYWHEGQLRAVAGDTQAAIPLLLAGVDPDDDAIGFSDYALGTVAFLDRDLEALKSARRRLAAKPRPVDFTQAQKEFKAKFGADLPWPPNLDVLDGLIACFDKPYRQAYGCQQQTPAK